MGVKVYVRGWDIEDAIKAFRNLVWRFGPPGDGGKRPKWHKKQLYYHLKPSERHRRDRLRDEFEKYAAECSRRQLVIVIRRHGKRRKAHFRDLPRLNL